MKLAVVAIRNHQLTYLLSIMLVLLGVVSYLTMPRAEDPLVEFPSVGITVISPGTHPEDMESLIVDVIEKQVNEIEDIKESFALIEEGMTRMAVAFVYGSDGDEKYRDVQAAVSAVRDSLPDGVVSIIVEKVNPNDVPIVQLALSSESGNFAQMRRISERLETRLEQVGGVKRVDIDAKARLEVQITLLPAKLHALGLSLEQVQQAVAGAAKNIPGGHALGGQRRFSVLTSGDFNDLAEIENTIIASRGGQPIYLRNIAKVTINDGLPDYRGFYKKRPALYINILQRAGSNIFDVTNGVKQQIEAFRQTLPSMLHLDIVNDQSIGVDKRVSGFFTNLVQGLILVAIATFIVLGRGPSVVVVLAIPVSIFIAIGWIDLTGFAIQQMSIVGLVIALGLLVDNAIVMTENVLRVYRQNDAQDDSFSAEQRELAAQKAAEQGSSQVSLAVISGTLTTILAFVPMLLMQNDSGSFIRSMPTSVVLTLMASLLVALTLTPLLSSQWLKRRARKNKAFKPTMAQRGLTALSQGGYLRSLNWSLKHPKTILMLAIVIFVGVYVVPYDWCKLIP